MELRSPRIEEDPRYTFENLRRLVEKARVEGSQEEVKRIFQLMDRQRQRNEPSVTRIPLPRFLLDFGEPFETFRARPDLLEACVRVDVAFRRGTAEMSVFVHAENNLLVCRIRRRGEVPFPEVSVSAAHMKPDGSGKELPAGTGKAAEVLRRWGYPPAEETDRAGVRIYWQRIPENGSYAIARARKTRGNTDTLCVSVACSMSSSDPCLAAEETVKQAAAGTSVSLREGHRAFWRGYWRKSAVSIPDARLESLFHLSMYRLGCNARAGKPPFALQGVWTQGDGGMPPWKGKYALNCNVQMQYWPAYTGDHLEEALPLCEWLWALLPGFVRTGRSFYGADCGMIVGGLGLNGAPCCGWYQTDLWPGLGAWMAHHF